MVSHKSNSFTHFYFDFKRLCKVVIGLKETNRLESIFSKTIILPVNEVKNSDILIRGRNNLQCTESSKRV